jgi:putative ABC transport system permease protein
MAQFLTESTLFSFLSFMIGMALARMILPFFNHLSGKALVFPWDGEVLLIILITAVVVGLMAGLNPAVIQ